MSGERLSDFIFVFQQGFYGIVIQRCFKDEIHLKTLNTFAFLCVTGQTDVSLYVFFFCAMIDIRCRFIVLISFFHIEYTLLLHIKLF